MDLDYRSGTDSQSSFLRRVAPLFYVNPYDDDSVRSTDGKNFAKLAAAFDIAPTADKETAQTSVSLFLDNADAFKLKQHNVFYYMFKYHAENIAVCYTGVSAYNMFSPNEINLVNEVFDTYGDIDYMLRMTDLEADFLMKNDFSAQHYNEYDMDVYRVHAASDINTSCDIWQREKPLNITKERCTEYLEQISRLDQSSSNAIRRHVERTCDNLLDYMSSNQTPNRLTFS